MKYFRLDLRDATAAKQIVWNRQKEAQKQPSPFHTSAVGLDCSIWTEDMETENLFRLILGVIDARYTEADEQQVIAKGFGIS